jgi:hypothetical protein
VPSELTSIRRPTALRLAGFVLAAAGAAMAGIGATRAWATTGFPDDDLAAADVAVHGTDLWEGKVVLFGAVAALLVIVAMRLARSAATRRGLALVIAAVGLAALALPLAGAVRPDERFGGTDGMDRMVDTISVELGQPEDVVRELLEEQLRRNLRVDLEPGLWLTAIGGAVLLAGGAANLVWARRGSTGSRPELG